MFKIQGVTRLLIGAALACAGTALQVADRAYAASELSVASFVPPQHHTNTRLFKWFGDELAKRTDGELVVKVYAGGQLGQGPAQQYKRVVEGVADIVIGVASYTPELFPRTLMTILPGKSENSSQLASRFMRNFDKHFAAEFNKVKFLGIGFPAGTSLSATRDLSTHESWNGAKIVPYATSMSPLVEAAGAVPVQLPVTDVYTSLSTGTIDAAVAAHNNMLKPWNWQDVTTHYIDNIPPTFQVVYFVMNQKRYQSLSPKHRKAIDELAGVEFTKVASGSFQKADEDALELMQKAENAKYKFIRVSDVERKKMDESSAKGMEVVFKQYDERGIKDARQIYADLNQ